MIVAMDVSNSMGADDVAPTRLAAAQQAARRFIDAQPDTVDIGVVGFDQGALTTSLPSADRAATKAAVETLRTVRRDIAGGGDSGLAERDHREERDDRRGRQPARSRLLGVGDDRAVLRRGGTGGGSERPPSRDGRAERRHTHRDGRRRHRRRAPPSRSTASGSTPPWTPSSLTALAQITGGTYHPASDRGPAQDVAEGIDLRLTVAKQDVPLAGGFSAASPSRCSPSVHWSPVSGREG